MSETPEHPKPETEAEGTETKPRGGLGSVLLGTVLIGVGIPMLILPGPGIAAILGGGALVARGVRRKGR